MISVVSESAAVTAKSTAPSSSSSSSPNASASTFDLNDDLDEETYEEIIKSNKRSVPYLFVRGDAVTLISPHEIRS